MKDSEPRHLKAFRTALMTRQGNLAKALVTALKDLEIVREKVGIELIILFVHTTSPDQVRTAEEYGDEVPPFLKSRLSRPLI